MAINASIRETANPPAAANGQTYRGPFAIMTVLFFMWGFMTVFNDILIPRFKEAFTLDYTHAMLVQFAFFGAYFVGSAAYFIISATAGDPIAKIGYKNGVVIGLLLSAFGSALFWPAANLALRSSIISSASFQNFPALVQKLNQQNNSVSIFVFQNLSESTRQEIKQNEASEKLKQDLAADLNKIVNGPSIYDAQRFSGVKLQPATKQLLAQNPSGEAVARLNRALLEDAYADEIEKDLLPYWVFLTGLFIVGLGFAMLQIAANPYVTILGPEKTASSRLNLAQAFNSVGTTTGPLIGGYLIFQYFAKTGVSGADSVKVPYLAFCIVFLILAAIFFFIHLPHVGEGKIEPGAGALKHPHVVLGVLAIFMYVGGEVSVGSSIINFLGQPNVAAMSAIDASKYVALFWGGMLIGRFMGAVELSEMKSRNKRFLLVGIPILAFIIVCIASGWTSTKAYFGTDDEFYAFASQRIFDVAALCFFNGWKIVQNYLLLLTLCWLLFQFGKAMAGRTLLIFSATIVVLLAIAIIFGGKLAMWCVVGVGLFTSIGWPNIFSLALDGMGTYKSQVSSLLVMAILGGAVLPWLLGRIADKLTNAGNPYGLQIAFIVPLIAYAYVAFYGWKGHRIGRNRHTFV
ncbi:MAG: sugar MFS transporter [Limisphaerales bacterium]